MPDALDTWLLRFRARQLQDRKIWRPSKLFGFFVLTDLPRNFMEDGDTLANVAEPQATPPGPDIPEWWEVPYPGAPMVKVKGFPRALYPPDAASQGKTPSEDGPDAVAYKRTVSRAGRWPWQAFDDSYSNAFAHGKVGGNVGDSGVAGVQRQGAITPDSGWIGEKTFNLLRSIIIPEGLAHAGEPAMDNIAADLIDEAWQKFKG